MADHILSPLLTRLRCSVRPTDGLDHSDRHLLERYAAGRDAAAFEALVRRHGPRVWSACRAVLADPADADDAFQATFLVLLDKAGSVRWESSLGGWLYAVAHRVSVRLRARSARRRRLDAGLAPRPPEQPTDLSWREACAVLHDELDRLPERYRRPLMLCYLEGRSRDEAARQLGWSEGSVKGRLERGRELLRRRLLRRGIGLSA